MAKNRIHEDKATMDFDAAIAFIFEEFEKLHPRSTWPDWLLKCTVDSCGSRDGDLRHRVAFAVTPKATVQPITYFEAAVDPQTALVTVLIDRDPSEFSGEDLQGFDPLTENPWLRA